MTKKKTPSAEVQLVGAIDQGTSSSRFLVGLASLLSDQQPWTWFSSWKIFDAATLKLITYYQESIRILTPQPGWVEQDPHEILDKTVLCIEKAVEQLQDLGYDKSNIKGREDGNERNEQVFVFP